MKKKSGKKIVIIIAAVVVVLLLILMFTGDDSEYDSYEDEEVTESTGSASLSKRDFLSEKDYPMGTATNLDGRTVVVSIFLNDNTTSWDFESATDQETIQKLSGNMSLGMDWIVEQGKKYGKNIEFIYNWDDDEELFYAAAIDCDFSTGESQIAEVKTFLSENFDEVSNKLLDKYEAENIIYAMYLNEKADTNMTCHAMPFNGTEYGYDMPYEPICLTNYVYGAEQGPATYAHELLHIFGAPDYYSVDEIGNNFGMTEEFVNYCSTEMVNDIMFSTYDPYTNTIPKDSVTNDFSELTAYYVGWTSRPEIADEYSLGRSQHE